MNHTRLLILGAGQYGMVAREVAEAMGTFDQIDFLDDNADFAVGCLDDLDRIDHTAAFVAIGNPDVRRRWLERIANPATLIHPQAVVSPSAKVGEGSIIEAGAVLCANAEIGRGAIVMANAVVGHDAQVRVCCQLKYNCTIPERCIVPDGAKVDCNVVYHDLAGIAARNKAFWAEEKNRSGAEPSFF